MKRLMISFLAFALLSGGMLQAQTVYEFTTTEKNDQTAKTELKLDVDFLKMNSIDDELQNSGELIYRHAAEEMLIVDHNERHYTVLNKETADEVGKMTKNANAMLEESLSKLPPEQREQMRKMMEKQMSAQPAAVAEEKIEVKKTTESATKNGYPCVKYEVFKNGLKSEELWATDWGNVEGGSEAMETIKKFAEFNRDLLKRMGHKNYMQGNPLGRVMADHGFPVEVHDLEKDRVTVLSSASKGSFSPEEFEAPAGYRKRSMTGK